MDEVVGERDIQLELKDRLRYNQIIEDKLRALAKAISNPKALFRTIQTMLLDLLTDIPDSWKDEDFENEMKIVIKERDVDVRPEWSGVKYSKEYCEANNIPITQKTKEINYFRLKNAIINLFDRRQLLIRRDKIEYTTGRKFETLNDLEDYNKKENEDI